LTREKFMLLIEKVSGKWQAFRRHNEAGRPGLTPGKSGLFLLSASKYVFPKTTTKTGE
jgi:hypothetical protein